MFFETNGTASFPENFQIHTLEVSLSLMVTSAPLWFYLSPQLFFKNGATLLQLFEKVEEELGEEIVCVSKT
jgi:hypothetical protein